MAAPPIYAKAWSELVGKVSRDTIQAHVDHHTELRPAEQGIRYVTETGNDLNDGQSWPTALASPQAAYDDLVTWAIANLGGDARKHVGVVHIGRRTDGGFYDVDDGLVLNNLYTCDFVGEVMTRLQDEDIQGTSRLGSTSATATALVFGTNTGVTSYGHKFINLGFIVDPAVNTAMTSCIEAIGWNFVNVKDCWARGVGGAWTGFFIEAEGGTDNSWWTVENNRVTGMGLLFIPGLASFNNNRWWVGHNQVFVDFTGSGIEGLTAMIRVKRLFDSTFIQNNLEGGNKAVEFFGGGGNCTWINNSGETNTHDNPFYEFNATFNHTIIGGRCETVEESQTGAFVNTIGTCGGIWVFNPLLKTTTDPATGFKDRLLGSGHWRVPTMEIPT